MISFPFCHYSPWWPENRSAISIFDILPSAEADINYYQIDLSSLLLITSLSIKAQSADWLLSANQLKSSTAGTCM